LAELPHGELELSKADEFPAFNSKWLTEQKFISFKEWLTKNFQRDEEFYFDFSDFENESELEDHYELYPVSTEELLKAAWGVRLSSVEFDGTPPARAVFSSDVRFCSGCGHEQHQTHSPQASRF
jgi:hypothetical protein